MSAAPLVRCPECGRDALQRLIGPGAGILFKGSGFYETDYKRASGKGGGKPGSGKTDGARTDAPSADAPKPGPAADATRPASPAPDSAAKPGQAPGKGSAPKDSRPG